MFVVIRGAGDIASGIALRLWRSGIQLAMLDLPNPTAIRRTVSFSPAIRYGKQTVEDVTALRADTVEDVARILAQDCIPVLADPEGNSIAKLKPDVVGRCDFSQEESRHKNHRCTGGDRRRAWFLCRTRLPRGGGDDARPLSGPGDSAG